VDWGPGGNGSYQVNMEPWDLLHYRAVGFYPVGCSGWPPYTAREIFPDRRLDLVKNPSRCALLVDQCAVSPPGDVTDPAARNNHQETGLNCLDMGGAVRWFDIEETVGHSSGQHLGSFNWNSKHWWLNNYRVPVARWCAAGNMMWNATTLGPPWSPGSLSLYKLCTGNTGYNQMAAEFCGFSHTGATF
jgi:hypothetical protein